MHRLRMLTLALALSLGAAACSSELGPDVTPTATSSPVDEQAQQAPAEDDAGDGSDDSTADESDGSNSGGDAGTVDDGAGAEENTGDGDADSAGGDEQPSLSPVADGGPVGANAAAYLRGDRPRVVLEVDVQEGARYADGVIAHVRDVLARESNASVEVQTGGATSTRRDAWTTDQLRAAAAESRNVAHSNEVAVLHLLVLRDRYEDDGVLGLAFGSSSAVVFPDQWSDLTTALISGDRIARAVSTHELGHLLGLVGLYEQPTSDHEDPDYPGHTTDRDDVMHYAVERDVISQLDGIPTDFGEHTRADLAAIRRG